MASSLIDRPIRKSALAAGAAAALAFSLVACADDETEINQTSASDPSDQTTEPAEDLVAPDDPERAFASAELVNQDGDNSGTVDFYDRDGKVEVRVSATDLTPGFHGMHIHETGLCEEDFSSAGGHLGDHDHGGGHAGDMPSILINEDGTGDITFVSDKLNEELLLDDDASAVIVHEDPDNFAHIPERYAPDGPDEDTLNTGDAGDRALCGVVEAT